MLKNIGFIFQFLLVFALSACQKKAIPQAEKVQELDQQKIVENYVKHKELKTKTVFNIREILAFDIHENLIREIQLSKENDYRIDISFSYDEQNRIIEEVLLGDIVRKPFQKFQYIYKENLETIVNRFYLEEKTMQWKAQPAIGKIELKKADRGNKKTKRAGFRFEEKEGKTDLENIRDMTKKNKISTKVVQLDQDVLVIILYMDYSI